MTGSLQHHKRRIIGSLQRIQDAHTSGTERGVTAPRLTRARPGGAPGSNMRCLAVCQDELVIRMLDQILASSIEVEFLVESRALAKTASGRRSAGHRRRHPPHRYLHQSGHLAANLRHHRGYRRPPPAEGDRRDSRCRRLAHLCAGRRAPPIARSAPKRSAITFPTSRTCRFPNCSKRRC